MNRLFWKFLLAFWLTLLAAALGVAFSLQMYQRARDAERAERAERGAGFARPPPRFEPGGPGGPGPGGPGPGGHRPPRPPPKWAGLSMPIVAAIAAIASLAFAALLAWYMTRPIRKLQWAFDAASKGQLDTRVQPMMGGRRDEIADLGAGFDQMAQKVQALVAAQQRLLHDVSHELRSPLARLQAAVDLARQQPELVAPSLDRIERETARLDQLVGQMLTLSRMEAHADLHAPSAFDFAELVAGIAADAGFEARAQQRDVVLRPSTEALAVRMDEEAIHRACENVIRNAVKFTAVGTSVEATLGLGADGKTITLEVADRGPGVGASDVDRMFEPFHRGPNTRGVDGHGLGLAIARHAVEKHGGTIAARAREGGGLVIRIELPR